MLRALHRSKPATAPRQKREGLPHHSMIAAKSVER
jgi:hypothetical protein